MINRVILVGRLTREPEVRKTSSGMSVCSFTLAVNRRKGKNAPANVPDADFISCVAWNQTADLMGSYLHKGSQIGVEGRIQTRNYDDPNNPGKKVYVTEVLAETVSFLESKSSTENRPAYNNSYNNNSTSYYADDNYSDMSESSPAFNISRDDLPF